MLKKALLSIIFTGILLALLSCSGGTVTETSPTPTEDPGIYITADGSGDYPDLETAIAQAEPRATIILEAGTYRLDKTLEISDTITLIGAGHEETTILSSAPGSVIHFTGKGLYTLKGITVQHEGTQLASAVRVDKGVINFSNCRLTGATIISLEDGRLAAGLFATEDSDGSVKNCVIDNNLAAGIIVAGNSNLSLENNTCQHNDGFGIVFRENASGTALNNKCNNNKVAGFFLMSNGKIQLKDNECSQNGTLEDSSGGIIVSGTTAPILEGNTCTDNPAIGIVYRAESRGTALNNDFSRNGLEGIYLEGNAAPEIEGNNCSQNGKAGIFVVDEAAPKLKGNTCNQNGVEGKGAGIAYFDKAGGTAIGNTVKNNRDGFYISAESTPELVDNVCSENGEYGIFYSAQNGGSAIRNQCAVNGKAGIMVVENSSPLLQENICFGNLAGIYIAETANPELVNNELYDNNQGNLIDLRP